MDKLHSIFSAKLRSFSIFTALTTILIFSMAATPAKADVFINEWTEFTFPVTDAFGCFGENGRASGVVHTVVSDFGKGDLAIHFNAKGILKGDNSGVEVVWKDNSTDIVPIEDFGNHVVRTISQSLKLIGQGGLAFRLKVNFHLTEVGGEFIVYFDKASFVCNV